MKIVVKDVGKGWRPDDKPDADPMYTISVEGQTEPQKTYDPLLAVVGEHEAEQYTAKSGKNYWRTPKPQKQWSKPQEKVFRADPDTRESIQIQQALIQAVALQNGSIEDKPLQERVDDTLMVASQFLTFLRDPARLMEAQTTPVITLPIDDITLDDLPPAELYDNLGGWNDNEEDRDE